MALSYADAAVVQEQLVLGHANLDVRLLKVWHKSRDVIFDRGAGTGIEEACTFKVVTLAA